MSWVTRARNFRRTSKQSPTAPTTPTSTNQAGVSITIGWAAVSGAVRYRIEHQQTNGTWREVGTSTTNSYVHTRTNTRSAVRTGVNVYRVRAESAKGHISAALTITSVAHT